MTAELEAICVSELYSPPRLARVPEEFGLAGGWGLNLATEDDRCNKLDFSRIEMQRAAVKKVDGSQPSFAIGSPMCTNFSITIISIGANWVRMRRGGDYELQ